MRKRVWALAAALLVLPLFTNPYWTDVCVSIGLYALLALSLNVILGQAGIFHMGHAAFFAVGAYSTAILNTMYHWPIFLTMPVAGCAAALFALVVARPIIHLRGDYLLIVTIGIVEIVRIALINDVGGLTGGSNGIFGISRPVFFGFRIFKPLHFYYLVWGMVGVSLLLFYGLWRSRIGRALNCIKEDDVAAEGCGINVTHYKLMAFVLGAFWAGMAGTLYAAKMTTIAPESFNFMESVIIFAVVILSGGSQLGVLVSAFLFIGLPELLREFSSFYRATLDNSGSLIPVSREVAQTKRYLTFEKARFGEDRVLATFDVSEDVEDTLVPAFVIQPIVENAVRHGMGDDDALRIDVTVHQDGDDAILIAVADNGVGMDEGTAARLFDERSARPDASSPQGGGAGVAMHNISERIHRFYGPHSYTRVESAPGKGTKVLLHLDLSESIFDIQE